MNRAEIAGALSREQGDALALWRSLSATDWERPSLCRGWTVRDTAEHLILGEGELYHENMRRALAGDASAPAGFDLARINDEQIARARSRSVAEMLDDAERRVEETRKTLESLSDSDFDRPAWNPIQPGTLGFYTKGRIWEWWTHGQDIRVPLRRPGGREPERVRPVVEVVREGIAGVFVPERSLGVHTSYAFQVAETGFTVRIDDGTCRVDPAFDRSARVRIKADPATFVLVGTRRISQMKAVLTGKFFATGNLVHGMKFLSYFRAP